MSKAGKQRLVRVFAGATVVLVSPFIARTVTENTGYFSSMVANAALYVEKSIIEENTPDALEMNSSALLLYKPSGNDDDPVVTSRIEATSPEIPPESTAEDITPESTETEAEPESAQVLSINIDGVTEDLSGYNSADGHIYHTTIETNAGVNFIDLPMGGQVRNLTDLENALVEEESQLAPLFSLELSGEPEVLIMHTHTSEAYQTAERGYYDASYTSRTVDPEQNVVAVGAEIARSLAEAGITVLHDGTIHDSPEYSGAYTRSEETVQKLLEQYPSIKVVLDIHRDAIQEPDGSLLAPVTEVDGEKAAQVMIISAADDGTYDIPEYLQNFRLASLFQQYMEYDNPGITRPVLFQYCHYNQQLSTGSLLIEVGSHGNTLEQALLTGRLVGQSIAAALLSL